MFKVILVDDEPFAIRYLNSIITSRCIGFEVIGHAENGEEGIKKIRLLKPDVVVADVKMPVMNGIELATCIKNEFPSVYTIIVSSYPDFEYTKGAIQSDVVDYILKPVNAVQFKELFESIKRKLEKDYYQNRTLILKSILNGKVAEEWRINRFLPFRLYNAAIIRFNGLPARHMTKRKNSVFTGAADGFLSARTLAQSDNIWVLDGRDEMESICICADDSLTKQELESYVESTSMKNPLGYTTIVLTSKSFALYDSKTIILNLYHVLNNVITVGVSRTVKDDTDLKTLAFAKTKLKSEVLSKISILVLNGRFDELKHEIKRLFDMWEEEKPTQLTLENDLKQILGSIKRHMIYGKKEDESDIDSLLDEALFNAANLGDLFGFVWHTIIDLAGETANRNARIDSPSFFDSIKDYLMNNLSELHSLQSVCENFYISQTYLSKLFRKYENISFNEFLTRLRISESKRFMAQNPQMPIKDVAALVGYSDQFYFSRVFKVIVGVPPSEYRSEDSLT